MNILYSVPRLHTNYSGMIQGLVNDGHIVSFIAMDRGQVQIPLNFNVNVYHFPSKKRFFTFGNRSKQLHFENFAKLNEIFNHEKPDLIITRDLQVLNFQISLIAKLRRIPVLYYDQVPPVKPKTLKRRIWYSVVHLFISKYRMTTVMNGDSVNLKEKKNTFFIPFVVPETVVKKHYPADVSRENPLKIIVVSKLGEERKNLLFLFESLLPFFKKEEINLSVYGLLKDNPDSLGHYEIIKDYIKNNELNGLVKLFPNERFEDVLKVYAKHDLFILPSLNEPAAISPFEAMSSGLPVIVTEQNGTNYVVEKGENGFIFNPESKQDLQEKVSFFLNNPEKIELFGREALKTINQNYRPNNFSKKIMSLMNRIND